VGAVTRRSSSARGLCQKMRLALASSKARTARRPPERAVKCTEPVCERAAEVSIHCDAVLVVMACLSCGIRLARGLHGRILLLDATRREITVTCNAVHPRGDCVK
jgi:hypothetical protein